MEIEIEMGIPLPESPSYQRYPFGRMAVGDSFTVSKDRRQHAAQAAGHWKRRHPGWDYATRAIGTEVRIWRIA